MITKDKDGVLASYPVLKYVNQINLFKGKTVATNFLVVTGLMTIAIIAASFFDKSLFLTGNNLGLFEHPTIWTFIIIQAITPFRIEKSVNSLYRFLEKNDLVNSKFDLSRYPPMFLQQIFRETNLSKLTYYLFVTIGFIGFVWNSYQNQLPLRFLGFDFWDSINHPLGYWVTRVYKLYLWMFFLPSCAHVQVVILVTLSQLLKDVDKKRLFVLRPYHQDGHGGGSELIKIVISPFVPILMVSSISFLCVLMIHRELDITLLFGLFVLSVLFISIYLIPSIALSKILKSEKQTQLAEIAQKQGTIFSSLIKTVDPNLIKRKLETLTSLDSVSKQIKEIPNWPDLNSILRLLSLAHIPALIAIVQKIWPNLSQFRF